MLLGTSAASILGNVARLLTNLEIQKCYQN